MNEDKKDVRFPELNELFFEPERTGWLREEDDNVTYNKRVGATIALNAIKRLMNSNAKEGT